MKEKIEQLQSGFKKSLNTKFIEASTKLRKLSTIIPDEEDIIQEEVLNNSKSNLIKHKTIDSDRKISLSYTQGSLSASQQKSRFKSLKRRSENEKYLTIFKFDATHLSECADRDRRVKFPRYNQLPQSADIRRGRGNVFRLGRFVSNAGGKNKGEMYPISILKNIFPDGQ